MHVGSEVDVMGQDRRPAEQAGARGHEEDADDGIGAAFGAGRLVELASELRARDSRHEGLFFDGVGHYLSAPEALAGALAAELAFYRRFLG